MVSIEQMARNVVDWSGQTRFVDYWTNWIIQKVQKMDFLFSETTTRYCYIVIYIHWMNSISIVILSIMELQLSTIIIDIFLKCVLVTDMEFVLFSKKCLPFILCEICSWFYSHNWTLIEEIVTQILYLQICIFATIFHQHHQIANNECIAIS